MSESRNKQEVHSVRGYGGEKLHGKEIWTSEKGPRLTIYKRV